MNKFYILYIIINTMVKRALILGTGVYFGTYMAGFASVLCKELGPKYFDAVYSCSVGVHAATFFASGQYNELEMIWKGNLDMKRMFNLKNFNPFSPRKPLDLEYLTGLYVIGDSTLDRNFLFNSGIKLTYVLTDCETGKAVYVEPNSENIFPLMRASCALPFFHGPVKIDGKKYLDGGLTDPFPVQKALEDGYDEVIVLFPKKENYKDGILMRMVIKSFAFFTSLKKISTLISQYPKLLKSTKIFAENDSRVIVIRPSEPLPLKHIFDSNADRLGRSTDIGMKDAYTYIASLS